MDLSSLLSTASTPVQTASAPKCHVPCTLYHVPHVPEWARLLWGIASNLVLSFTTLCLMALPIHNANFVPSFLSFFLCLCSADSVVVLIYAVQISVLVLVVNMP